MYDEPPATVELFCQRHVEPMGEESDHLHIVAVTEALQVCACERVRVGCVRMGEKCAWGGVGGVGGDCMPEPNGKVPAEGYGRPRGLGLRPWVASVMPGWQGHALA